MFCDTHCHLFKEDYDDVDDIINSAKLATVNRMIVAGVNHKTNEEVLTLLNKDGVYGALGIHPEEVNNYKEEDIQFIKDNLTKEKVVAIGEIGLDYHYEKETREKQIKLFEEQLKIASERNIPVVIHSREATNDTINCLKKYKVKGVIHSFTGSLETAKIYIKMGFLLGINGVVTFKNCNLKEVLREIDLTNIVLETDAPYLTPVPFRGEKNSPAKLINVALFISDIKGIFLEELAKITNENIHRIFDI